MESSKDFNSVKSSARVEGDGDNYKDHKRVQSVSELRNSTDNPVTATSIRPASIVSQNGPGNKPMISGDHSNQHSNDNHSDAIAIACSSQSQSCYNVNNTSTDRSGAAAAGGSKFTSNISDNGTSSNQDTLQRHKFCLSSNSQPSTSGTSRSENPENCAFRENRKRPSSLKLNRPELDDDSSSDTGNDDYSLGSEDGCIYTYRGGEHLADLPSSFFSLDMGLPLDRHLPMPNYPVPQQGAAGRDSRASSPDMDFLEMDFDPGPSCEADTGDESSPDMDLEAVNNMPEESEPVQGTSPEYVPPVRQNVVNAVASTSSATHSDVYAISMPSTSRGIPVSRAIVKQEDTVETVNTCYSFGPYITHVNTRGEQLLVRRTMTHGPINVPISLHVSSGNLVSPAEVLNYDEDYVEGPIVQPIKQASSMDSANLSSAFYHLTMVKKLIAEKNKLDSDAGNSNASDIGTAQAGTSTSGASCVEPPRCMIWSESDACERQVTQIGTSACGATAVVNVFNALGVPVNIEKINSAVGTRQRANNAPIPRYLLSRAVAGCTAADLVTGIHSASDGLVTARFFPTFPERVMSLSHWLADWITLGAVPILTLNLQVGCEGEIPDAWHHQMVFGVSVRGVYLCNPVECVRESNLWPRLTSPSVLLVRTRDVLTRFTKDTDLTPLMVVPDRRFQSFNVLGQVVNLIREWRAVGWGETSTRTRHIRLPASYQAGVTVAALTGSEAHRRLMAAPQLPVLAHTDPA